MMKYNTVNITLAWKSPIFLAIRCHFPHSFLIEFLLPIGTQSSQCFEFRDFPNLDGPVTARDYVEIARIKYVQRELRVYHAPLDNGLDSLGPK
jgi:hypothetical protein